MLLKNLTLSSGLLFFSAAALAYTSTTSVPIERVARACTVTQVGSSVNKAMPGIIVGTNMVIITNTNKDPKTPIIWNEGEQKIIIQNYRRDFVGTSSTMVPVKVQTQQNPWGDERLQYTILNAPENILFHQPVSVRKGLKFTAELYFQTTAFKLAELFCTLQ